MELLLKALDNEENEKLLELTTKKINQTKSNMIKELMLPAPVTKEILTKLKHYMYIDEMNELRYGAFLRWINIVDPNNLFLSPGGILCEINITENGIVLVCKNFAHKYYQLKMDECLLFQKLSTQELVLLSALDHLEKKT
uniref:Uncharacterized protein n=1 Tax=viral metagenome TaxID=1070528 RepID=A0A6C0AZF4_9ZZZZ